MNINLRYGRSGLPVELPDSCSPQILHLNPLPVLDDAVSAVARSLLHPIASRPLLDLARGKHSACIVISDVTRPVPNRTILAPLLATLKEAGLADSQIVILIATGLHRPNEGEELKEMIGDIGETIRVVNHFARKKEDMVSLGQVSFGQGWECEAAINRHYAQAELKITTGLIEPHLMAGFSGGRKVICPGIASAETILQFHAPAMIAHPEARTGNLAGNPIHAMSRAVAGKVGCDFICNVTLSEHREITGVFSGDMDEAHAAGVTLVKQGTQVPATPTDVVLTTSAGYPLDTTFYQCVKGMVAALPALRPGGTLIIAAGLEQGIGGPEFTQLCHSLKSPQEFLDRISQAQVGIDQWQLQEYMQVLQHAGQVVMVTKGVDASTLRRFLLTPADSVEKAVAEALAKHKTTVLTVIPEGPYVTPVATL